MKDYKDYMESISAPETLHKAVAECQNLQEHSVVIKFNPMFALAASLVLIIGIATAVVFWQAGENPFAGDSFDLRNDFDNERFTIDEFLDLMFEYGFMVEYESLGLNSIYFDGMSLQRYQISTGLHSFDFYEADSVADVNGWLSSLHNMENGCEDDSYVNSDGEMVFFDGFIVQYYIFVRQNAIVFYYGQDVELFRFFYDVFGSPVTGCMETLANLFEARPQGEVLDAFLSFLDGKAGGSTDYEVIHGDSWGALPFDRSYGYMGGSDIHFLSVPEHYGRRIRFYELSTDENAREFMKKVSSDGTVVSIGENANMLYGLIPHWFVFDNAVMLYQGQSEEILRFLRYNFDYFAGCGVQDNEIMCIGCLSVE